MIRSNCILLLSGGIDSTTLLALLMHEGYNIICLTFDYNQAHQSEIKVAKKIIKLYGIRKHVISKLSFQDFNSTTLIKHSSTNTPNRNNNKIPMTYVPFRNMTFLTYASALAEKLNIYNVYIGVNGMDGINYPDCTKEFIQSFEKTANLGSRFSLINTQPLKIHAPFISKQKDEIIKMGLELGVDYSITHTCYYPNNKGIACGKCDACQKRLNAFSVLNIKDSLCYNE